MDYLRTPRRGPNQFDGNRTCPGENSKVDGPINQLRVNPGTNTNFLWCVGCIFIFYFLFCFLGGAFTEDTTVPGPLLVDIQRCIHCHAAIRADIARSTSSLHYFLFPFMASIDRLVRYRTRSLIPSPPPAAATPGPHGLFIFSSLRPTPQTQGCTSPRVPQHARRVRRRPPRLGRRRVCRRSGRVYPLVRARAIRPRSTARLPPSRRGRLAPQHRARLSRLGQTGVAADAQG